MRWVWRILAVFGILVLVLGFIAVFLGERAENRLAAYLAQLEKEGVVLDVANLRSSRQEGTEFYSGPIEEVPRHSSCRRKPV